MAVNSFISKFNASDQVSLREIKVLSQKVNPDAVNLLLKNVSSIVPRLVDDELMAIRVERNTYRMNKTIRKRNGIYSILGPINDSINSTSPFFSLFQGYSKDIEKSSAKVNAPVNALRKKYYEYKYLTKKYSTNGYTFSRVSQNELEYKDYIDSFRNYFFES